MRPFCYEVVTLVLQNGYDVRSWRPAAEMRCVSAPVHPIWRRCGGISLQRAVGLSCLLHRFNVFLYQQLMLDLGSAYATLLRQRGDSAGESGIIAWLHELKQLSGPYIPGEL